MQDVALGLSLEGLSYPRTGVSKDKQRAGGEKGKVLMGSRQRVFQENWILIFQARNHLLQALS